MLSKLENFQYESIKKERADNYKKKNCLFTKESAAIPYLK